MKTIGRMARPVPPLLLLGGCGPTVQSALSPQGPSAERMADLIWSFTYLCAFIWLLVVLALAWAILRRRRSGHEQPVAAPAGAQERRLTLTVTAAVALTAVVLIVLNVASYLTDKGIDTAHGREAVTIHVKGHQWWWEAIYEQQRPDRMITTANEIHIPVGKPVKLKLTSSDVIHSFWVPNLTGKMDLIPGRENDLFLIADRPGVYRGQCAEFCGLQHAHMSLLVIAEPQDAFDAWVTASLRSAEPPADPLRQRGLQLFQGGPCAGCHTVLGTSAAGKMGPDLTHVGSRQTLAAGTLPNTVGNLAGWIADPQGIKPGARMPAMALAPADLQALVRYVEGLR